MAIDTDFPYSAFPSDFIDPQLKKQKKYNIDYAKAAYYEYVKDAQLLTTTRRNDFIDNRLYAEANQNNTKYKKFFTFRDEADKRDVSFANLDYSIVSPIPGYRDIVLSYLEKLEYDVDFVAIDPISDNTRNQEVYKKWAEKMLQGIFQREEINAQIGNPDEVYPETKEELEIFKNMGFKLKWEIAMKGIVDLDFYENGWVEIKRKVLEDLFDCGIAGTREFSTKEGRHILRYVDPVNLYVRQTRDKECKNSNSIGEVFEMTLSELVAQAGDQFTEAEYKQIAKLSYLPYTNTIANLDFVDTDTLQSGSWLSWFTTRYGDYKIKIFDLAWFSFDKYFYEKKVNAHGSEMLYEKPFGHKIRNYEYESEMVDGKMKYSKKDADSGEITDIPEKAYMNEVQQSKGSERRIITENRKMVYGAKWIVGTDFVYDYGLQYDLPRDPMPNGKDTNLPFHIYRLNNKSIIERAKPLADAFMLSWLKIQNAKAKARPKGIMIELDSLENMTIAGKSFTPLQALAVYDQTGNMIYKGTGQFGDATRHTPVQELTGGMGQEYAELIGDLNYSINMIQNLTGFNAIFLAQSPDPNQPVKTAQLAVQATNNALYPISQALRNIHIRTVKSTACRFQIMSKYRGLKGYDQAINEGMLKVIEYADDMSLYNYGIKVVARPTDEQKAAIEGAAIQAMNTRDETGQGEITFSDYLFIKRILDGGNMKYAEAVLAHRKNKRMAEKHQRAIQLQQENGKIQIQSAQMAEEEKRKSITIATDEAIRLETAKAQLQIQVDNNKMGKMVEIEQIKTGGKITQTQEQSKAKVVTKVLENENKKEVAKLKPKVKAKA